MTEDDNTLTVNGPVYQDRVPLPSDCVVTPENLAREIEAMQEGWSRNVWRVIGGRGHELVLWPRRFHDAPPLTLRILRDPITRTETVVTEGGYGRRLDRQSRSSLARYMWGYDLARYPAAAPTPLRGLAWVRDCFASFLPGYGDPLPVPAMADTEDEAIGQEPVNLALLAAHRKAQEAPSAA